MYLTICEDSDCSVYETIPNKRQDTALIEHCPKSSSQQKSTTLLQDCIYDFQKLPPASEPYLISSKHEPEYCNSFCKYTCNDQLHKASIQCNQWLNHDNYCNFKACLNCNGTIQEPKNSRCPDNIYQCQDKSESESSICCVANDAEILNNGNYLILIDDCQYITQKQMLHLSQGMDCPKTNENLDSISQYLDNASYVERLKTREFLADEKHASKIPIQEKRMNPRVLKRYQYVPRVNSKQTERTNMANVNSAESNDNYEVLEYQEDCISDNRNQTPNQKEIVCSKQPNRLTDCPDTLNRYPNSEVLGSTRSSVEDLENTEYFTLEVPNQNRRTSLRQPETFQNYPGGDFEYEHPRLVDDRTNMEDKEKQQTEGRYVGVPLCEIISSAQSEYLCQCPERKEDWPGFHKSLPQIYLNQKNLAMSKVCSETSRRPTGEMGDGFSNQHQKNLTLGKHSFSLDRKNTSRKKTDLPTNDNNPCVGKCPNHLNSQKQPPPKDLSYPNLRREIYECSDPSCKCRESKFCLVSNPNYRENYKEPIYQERAETKPSYENMKNSSPEMRSLSRNSRRSSYSLASNYWQGNVRNIAERSDPERNDLLERKPRRDRFSVRDPNDFITTEEAADIVRNLKLQSENSIELLPDTDNLKEFDNGNASSGQDVYETIDDEPDYKVLCNLSVYKSVRVDTPLPTQKSHSIFKRFFRKPNKKSRGTTTL